MASQFRRTGNLIKCRFLNYWGQIHICFMVWEPSGSLFVSGVYFFQWAGNCAGSGAIQACPYLLCHAGLDPVSIAPEVMDPGLLDVNYPDRSATTILAGGSGG